MLDLHGIDNEILESRGRDYVEHRQRAGLIEQATVDFLAEIGVDKRLRREGLVHGGIELRFDGRGHRIAMDELTGGRTVTIYAQTEIVTDLIVACMESGGSLLFETEAVALGDIDGERPRVRAHADAGELEIE